MVFESSCGTLGYLEIQFKTVFVYPAQAGVSLWAHSALGSHAVEACFLNGLAHSEKQAWPPLARPLKTRQVSGFKETAFEN